MTNISSPAGQQVRQISSTPKLHRAATLDAIRQKTHDIGASVEYLRVENKRLKDLVAKAPGKGQSRLDWLATQINAKY